MTLKRTRMELLIRKPGLLSTLQDMGRFFHRAEAVPVSGPMDALSARIANRALGNEDNAPVIEFTYGGAELIAGTALLIAVSGEGAVVSTSLGKLPKDRPVYIPKGTLLALHTIEKGSRLYMGVIGGWKLPEQLGSCSTYLPAGIGGLQGRALKAGDRIQNESSLSPVSKNILGMLETADGQLNYPGWSIARHLFFTESGDHIRMMKGHEFDWLEKESADKFLTASFQISRDSSRMGCFLEGEEMKKRKPEELLSTAVAPGTIQLTGNGSLILLMADAQTTGGYPRIAQVAAVDMPKCGQLRPGDTIRFTEISWNEAETLYFAVERQLAEMTAAIAMLTY